MVSHRRGLVVHPVGLCWSWLAMAALLVLCVREARAQTIIGDAAAGKVAFAPCASCHQVGPSARNGFGPSLNGVVGRPAATSAGYAYSAALQESKIVWSEASLALYIRNPGRMVPGTKMRFFGLGYGDQKMADLVAYLRTFAPASAP